MQLDSPTSDFSFTINRNSWKKRADEESISLDNQMTRKLGIIHHAPINESSFCVKDDHHNIYYFYILTQ